LNRIPLLNMSISC